MSIANPELYCPFPRAVNPHVDDGAHRSLAWARGRRLVPQDQLRRFRRAEFSGLAAATCPMATVEDLALVTDVLVWIFLHDDLLDSTPLGRDSAAALAFESRLVALARGATPSTDDGPLAVTLANLRRRIARRTSVPWMERFTDHLEHYLLGNLLETQVRVAGTFPTVGEFLHTRSWAGAIEPCLALSLIVQDVPFDRDFFDDHRIRNLFEAVNQQMCWVNDLFGWSKEMAEGNAVNNLVCVLRHDRGLPLEMAIREVAQMCDDAMRHILELEAELRATDLDRTLLEPTLACLRAAVRGNLDWYAITGRYTEEDRRPQDVQ